MVVVRWAPVDGIETETARAWTTGETQARLVAFRRPLDREHFVGARDLLVRTVAEIVGGDPDVVRVDQRCTRCGGPHGRPTVTIDGATGPHVSLAHAGGTVMVGVASNSVGVDLEPADRPIRAGIVADIRTWVRLEALLKATGHGLDVDPRHVDLGPSDEPPRLVAWRGPGRTPAVRMSDIDAGPALAACVAVRDRGRGQLRVDAAATTL